MKHFKISSNVTECLSATVNITFDPTTLSTVTKNRLIRILTNRSNPYCYNAKVTRILQTYQLYLYDQDKDRYNRLSSKEQKEFAAYCMLAGFEVNPGRWDFFISIKENQHATPYYASNYWALSQHEKTIYRTLEKRLQHIAPKPIVDPKIQERIDQLLKAIKTETPFTVTRELK